MNDSTQKTDVPATPSGGAKSSAAAASRPEPSSSGQDSQNTPKLSLKALVSSILAGAIGVQSNKNRELDFGQQSIWPFVLGGVVFTIIFIVSLVSFASFVSR